MTFFQQGLEKARQGDYQGAIQDFTRALQLDPSDPEAYGQRCVAHYLSGDRQRAIADCQQAATLYQTCGKSKEYQYSLSMLKKL